MQLGDCPQRVLLASGSPDKLLITSQTVCLMLIMARLEEVREEKIIPELKPDGKCLVTVEYEDGEAERIHSFVLSTQHDECVKTSDLRKRVYEHVFRYVLKGGFPLMKRMSSLI